MASQPKFSPHPSYSKGQYQAYMKAQEALPIALSYLAEEIPVLDNHTDAQLVDEVGVLKQAKKTFEKAEKAHVERLKARMGDRDDLTGGLYKAQYRGTKRVILNQEACKALVEQFDEEGIHLGRLLNAIKSGQLQVPQNCFLVDPAEEGVAPELNHDDFFTTAAGGRSLYVEPIA